MKRDNILDPKFESLVSTINDHSVKENECFILYMIYLYIKCLLKNSRFYPDTTLRLLLFCKQHNSKKHSNSEQEPWMCVYGLDETTLKDILKDEKTREILTKVHCETYFEKAKWYHI